MGSKNEDEDKETLQVLDILYTESRGNYTDISEETGGSEDEG